MCVCVGGVGGPTHRRIGIGVGWIEEGGGGRGGGGDQYVVAGRRDPSRGRPGPHRRTRAGLLLHITAPYHDGTPTGMLLHSPTKPSEVTGASAKSARGRGWADAPERPSKPPPPDTRKNGGPSPPPPPPPPGGAAAAAAEIVGVPSDTPFGS